MINNIAGLFYHPNDQWQNIAKQNCSVFSAIIYTALFALIPAVAWFYGTTQIGWTVGDGEAIKLTSESGRNIIILFYLTMLVSVVVIGYMIHWMAMTYGAESSTGKGVTIAAYTATPLFIAGAVGFLPTIGIALLIALSALSYALYLLYTGIPAVMGISKERGFLFSSAVVAVCMVILMVIMGGSVILWDFGAAPNFTD